jgi:hypothetical protein
MNFEQMELTILTFVIVINWFSRIACGSGTSCILLFSDVSVFAVLQEALDEPSLRSLTTTVLRDAINGDALNEFLLNRNG